MNAILGFDKCCQIVFPMELTNFNLFRWCACFHEHVIIPDQIGGKSYIMVYFVFFLAVSTFYFLRLSHKGLRVQVSKCLVIQS